jgi:2-C-methyl-D-erythritol 4-phosphate cytidylyltransferase
MIAHSLETLASFPDVEAVVVVLPAEHSPGMGDELTSPKIWSVVEGGNTRQASLEEALMALPPYSETVVVHDAARPLLSSELLGTLLKTLDPSCDGVIPAIPLEDALKSVSEDGEVLSALDRRGVWRAQTPQVFRRSALEDSVRQASNSGTQSHDCSEMLTIAGYRVRVVRGDPFNLKVTTASDLRLAELILEGVSTTGSGTTSR